MMMRPYISPLIKIYVKNRAKRAHIILPKDYLQILRNAIARCGIFGVKVAYLWIWDCGGRMPNASSTIPGVIMINAEWAAMLAIHSQEECVRDAFEMTIWHEMAHQEGDYFFLEPFSKSARFVYWVNEVHADFRGIEKAFSGDVERGIRSLEFKLKCKKANDKDTYSHPSWKRRIFFISNYDFDDRLIREVARITKCDNKDLINRLCSYYTIITLKR